MISADELWKELEELGQEEVQKRLAQQVYSPYKLPLVNEWLARKQRQRDENATRQQGDREVEALKLSAEANSIARQGTAIAGRSSFAAWSAVVISLLSLAFSIVTWVSRETNVSRLKRPVMERGGNLPAPSQDPAAKASGGEAGTND